MEETTNSIKDAIQERLTNPFLGKLLLAWIIWNWKIPYISFFVREESLIPFSGTKKTNKLEFVSNYLTPDSFWDFCNIYFVPLLITAILIWVIPKLSNIVFNVSENNRRDRAIKKKNIDDEISGHLDKRIKSLSDEVELSKREKRKVNLLNSELRRLIMYLDIEFENLKDEQNERREKEFLNQFNKEIIGEDNKDRIFSIINSFHENPSNDYFDKITKKQKDFLIEHYIIKYEEGSLELSPFGSFIANNILYDKFSNLLPKFDLHSELDELY